MGFSFTSQRNPAYTVPFFVLRFRQFLFQIVLRDVFLVRHFCGDDDLVFLQRTRTVFLVIIFFRG